MHYLDSLNEAQRIAVENTHGPSMVIAGAGSGKTRVLTFRIAHLIHQGADPFSILALTFTNKAAREMTERISAIVGEREARNIWMGTFHSVFSRILRVEAEKLGYPSNFTIYDTTDSKNLIKAIIKELGLDDKAYRPSIVYNRISSAKNNLISPEAYAKNTEYRSSDKISGKPQLFEIYKRYALRCFKAGAMDFDDLLFKTNVLFRDFPDILHKYQHRFKFLLVDEYQDTNYSQYLIVKKLAAVYENLCVVGDDAQSIYAFRGANIQNILNFRKDYPGYKLYKLEQNYRSTQTIVEVANRLIANNKDQIKKTVWTANETGPKIKLFNTLTDSEEGKVVAHSIFEIKSHEMRKPKDFVILYRTNAQSRALEEALRKIDIPYRIYGGLSFYQRKEIKDLLAYYRMVVNPADEEAFKRIINYPKRGIGQSTLERLVVASNHYNVSIWDLCKNPDRYTTQISSGAQNKIREFVMMIESFRAMQDSKNAFALGKHIAASSDILKELYQDKSPEGVGRHENVEELLNAMREFSDRTEAEDAGGIKTLGEFLQEVVLLTDQDNDKDKDPDHVSLMTIHMAKGLEFPYVYIVGLEENLFPSQMSVNSRADLEEERRLFYVALTRAEKRVFLSCANTRYKWGNLIRCEQSRFLEEIDTDYLEVPERQGSGATDFNAPGRSWGSYHRPLSPNKTTDTPPASGTSSKQISGGLTQKRKQQEAVRLARTMKKVSEVKPTSTSESADNGSVKIQVGMHVEHSRFGTGKVEQLEQGKATVFFPKIGRKQLLLKFARLKIVE